MCIGSELVEASVCTDADHCLRHDQLCVGVRRDDHIIMLYVYLTAPLMTPSRNSFVCSTHGGLPLSLVLQAWPL